MNIRPFITLLFCSKRMKIIHFWWKKRKLLKSSGTPVHKLYEIFNKMNSRVYAIPPRKGDDF